MRLARSLLVSLAVIVMAALFVVAQEPEKKPPVAEDAKAKFEATFRKMSAEKPAIMRDARQLLAERYDLTDRPAAGVTMTRGKPVQDGVRVKRPAGVTWQQLAAMSPAEIRSRGVWPHGFMPLPHPNHPEGGMLFPQFHIDEVKRQTDRDLTRFDLDFDIPDPFLPEFPPPIFLTTRPDLGDVSQGKVVISVVSQK